MSVHRESRKRAIRFAESKYKKLPEKQRRSSSASLLREIYEKISGGADCRGALDHYNELQKWGGGEPLEELSLEAVADRYHRELALAELSLKEHNLLPPISRGDRGEGAEPWPIAIYLSNLRSAHNVGSIARTVEALRLGTLTLCSKTPSFENAKVQKTSMGAYLHIPWQVTDEVESLPRPLIALETSDEAPSLYSALFPESFTLALGNEELGLSERILNAADHVVSIPMRGRKNSLNVANAFSMAAYEIARQRQGVHHARVQ